METSKSHTSTRDAYEKAPKMANDAAQPPRRPNPLTSKLTLPQSLKWIPANLTWSKLKPVIRSAVAAWVGAIVFVIPTVETTLGQASFLILIASFISPPSDPLVAVLERELLTLLFVGCSWAWCCLALTLANLAREVHDPTASQAVIFTGQYIEAKPIVILAVFLFIGTAVLLYIKARQGPGPYTPATLFGCIALDICLTTGALFPYPYYSIGQIIMVPLCIHSALSIIFSVLLFPLTASAQFTARFQGVIGPLIKAMQQHRQVLATDVEDPQFSHSSIIASVNGAEAALVPLAVSGRLLSSDMIYGRFAPSDYKLMHNLVRRLVVRANGMQSFFAHIDPTRERFPITPVTSRLGSPIPSRAVSPSGTPSHSRAPSPERGRRAPSHPRHVGSTSGDQTPIHTSSINGTIGPNDAGKTTAHRRRKPVLHIAQNSTSSTHHNHHQHRHFHSPHFHFDLHQAFLHPAHHHHHSRQHRHLHNALLHFAISREMEAPQPVGVFESKGYELFEASRGNEADMARFSALSTQLTNESCKELLEGCEKGLKAIQDWFNHVRDGRWEFWKAKEHQRVMDERLRIHEEVRDELMTLLDDFRFRKRLLVIDPWRRFFEPSRDTEPDSATENEPIPHRYLFHCYVYQYHLQEFAIRLLDMLSEIVRLETERRRNKLWTPATNLLKLLPWLSEWDATDVIEHNEEENPDVIPGMQPAWMDDLGMPLPRDPDALPPRNLAEVIMSYIYAGLMSLQGGNVLFALKGGLLTCLLCIPAYLKSTAGFCYEHKTVWAIVMGQLTIARFRGDTTFGWVARVFSTFMGGVLGMVMWYISAGNGTGNPYGLAAVCFVLFPILFYARLYWPIPPMTNLIFLVTTVLVIGYSYQDGIVQSASAPGQGFAVAWRRWLLVTIGVTAAFIFSFFPPATTIRRYQRASLATVSSEIGAVYCSIVSYAHSPRTEDTQEIVQSLIAIRAKLRRSLLLRANVIYEFSLRGRWPAERYKKILDLEMQLAYALSHMMSVIEHLDRPWSRAFLRRTRFVDSDFQGDILSVISMISTSLRTGTPLPQITPCPLVDRFLAQEYGFSVVREGMEDDFGLPRTMTIEILENEQYMMFCVGVSTAFTVCTLLDRLMVAVKELVGEQYHIHGVGIKQYASRKQHGHGLDMASRTESLQTPMPSHFAHEV